MYWITQFSFTRKLCSVMELKIFIFVLSPRHTLRCKRARYFNATRDDKINDCGFKFRVACQWRVLIEEGKDNLLQLAKVFSAKFLKLPIRHKVLSRHRFALYGSLKLYILYGRYLPGINPRLHVTRQGLTGCGRSELRENH